MLIIAPVSRNIRVGWSKTLPSMIDPCSISLIVTTIFLSLGAYLSLSLSEAVWSTDLGWYLFQGRAPRNPSHSWLFCGFFNPLTFVDGMEPVLHCTPVVLRKNFHYDYVCNLLPCLRTQKINNLRLRLSTSRLLTQLPFFSTVIHSYSWIIHLIHFTLFTILGPNKLSYDAYYRERERERERTMIYETMTHIK